MSKISGEIKRKNKDAKDGRVVNYMGGYSYTVNPLDTLKMISASSIFGEPQYYRNGKFSNDGTYKVSELFKAYSVLPEELNSKKTSEIMEDVIDKALDYDFKGTLEWAKTLRTEFNMRLNPQIIMVRAAEHPKRQEFTAKNPGAFAETNKIVMSRADEPASQFAYYLFKNKNKNKIPGILKKTWKDKLSGLNAYQLNKYKNAEIGMIDLVRVCHACSPEINELMKTGTVEVAETDQKWETLKASGKTWKEILDTISLGHMALLRNLRGIFTEIDDLDLCKKLMEQLKRGVKNGKQFPFRYKTAMDMIDNSNVNHKQLILDTLEECIDIAAEDMPKLSGKTICLSDNSGSARHTFNSEFGRVTIANIDNLSSVITARNSDEGYVGVFGDKLTVIPVSKRNGVLKQTTEVDNTGKNVGMSTENGIWLFFKNAIDNKEHWDNIVIYSDMQAGHGGLYGTHEGEKEYIKRGFNARGSYVDVAKLINEYRKINPKVNVYCIQTAGYDNVLVPEYGYRTNIFYGWTGKELNFIDAMNRFWDEHDNRN